MLRNGFTRRNFIEVGASILGLGLVDVLRMQASAADTPTGGNAPPCASEDGGLTPPARLDGKKSLIVFWTHGGMSQQDTYDLKPDAPAEYRGPYRPIATNVPGLVITERFPQQARVMDKLSIVRSVNHQNGIH